MSKPSPPGLQEAGFLPLDTPTPTPVPPHYLGHRERLRARFLERGADSLADYELIELLLFPAIPRRDVKPLAKALLATFGNVWGVVSASPARLRREFDLNYTVIAAITIVGAVALQTKRTEISKKPLLSSWQNLLDYCISAMGHQQNEQFRLLFLDRKNHLINDEVHQHGTIDHTPAYPREIVRRALELGASSLILVHNHPSGDLTPSRADIEVTKRIVQAAEALGISVHDHVIIGRDGAASFKSLGLL
jgi:DNA repair protein RadC